MTPKHWKRYETYRNFVREYRTNEGGGGSFKSALQGVEMNEKLCTPDYRSPKKRAKVKFPLFCYLLKLKSWKHLSASRWHTEKRKNKDERGCGVWGVRKKVPGGWVGPGESQSLFSEEVVGAIKKKTKNGGMISKEKEVSKVGKRKISTGFAL